jgi:hypothetical protein
LIARASLLVAALAACSSSPPPVARSARCASIEMASVGPALTDPQHPCREWLASVYGRVAPLGEALATLEATERDRIAGFLDPSLLD